MTSPTMRVGTIIYNNKYIIIYYSELQSPFQELILTND